MADTLASIEAKLKSALRTMQLAPGNLPGNIEDIEHEWGLAYKDIKHIPSLDRKALCIQRKIWAAGYCFPLLSSKPIDHTKFYESIRYIIDFDLADDVIADITGALCQRPELWFCKWPERGNVASPKQTKVTGVSPRPGPLVSENAQLMAKALFRAREKSRLDRTAGTRGNPAEAAAAAPEKKGFVKWLLDQLRTANGELRAELALGLGEWGGESEAKALRNELLLDLKAAQTDSSNERFKLQLSLISALANIGGPVAVDTLLELAQSAPKPLAVAALSSLEFLTSGGSVALTEAPEPPSIDTPELREAYERLVQRLVRLSDSSREEYVRYKADQLIETIELALRPHPADRR